MKTIDKSEIGNLTKAEKIELLKKVQSGVAVIANNQFIEDAGAGIISFDRAGRLFLGGDSRYEVSEDFVQRKLKKEAIVFMPVKDTPEMSGEPFPMPEVINRLAGAQDIITEISEN